MFGTLMAVFRIFATLNFRAKANSLNIILFISHLTYMSAAWLGSAAAPLLVRSPGLHQLQIILQMRRPFVTPKFWHVIENQAREESKLPFIWTC